MPCQAVEKHLRNVKIILHAGDVGHHGGHGGTAPLIRRSAYTRRNFSCHACPCSAALFVPSALCHASVRASVIICKYSTATPKAAAPAAAYSFCQDCYQQLASMPNTSAQHQTMHHLMLAALHHLVQRYWPSSSRLLPWQLYEAT